MVSLNLLSPEKKEAVSNQMIVISLQHIFSWILIIICAIGVILLTTKLIMQNSFNQSVRQSSLVTLEYGTLNQKVHAENQKIKFLTSIQKSFIVWSPKLAAVSSLTPKNIELYSINIDNKSRQIQILGEARTRDDLLSYKQQLETSSLLKEISLPIENLLEAEDVSFEIKAKLP